MKSTLQLICTVGFVALFTACGSDSATTTSESQESATIHEVTSENSSEKIHRIDSFPPHQDFYNNLLRRSNCEFLKFVKGSITEPVTCSEFKSSIATFGESYLSDGQLDYHPSKIPLTGSNNRLVALIDRIANEERYGLVFHYGFEDDTIVYILSRGQLDDANGVQYCPFEDGNDGFFVLLKPRGNDPYQEIDQQRFNDLTQEYFSHMRINDTPNPTSLDPSVHARMVYHKPDGLLRFFEAFRKFGDLYLYINHGVLLSPKNDRLYHVPILTLGDQNIFYEIDNNGGTPNVFYKKALDVGRLCPPNCATIEPICN